MSFAHQGSEVWYAKDMKTYKICPPPESNSCSNSLGAGGYNTGDHSMDTYLTLPASFPEYLLRVLKDSFEMIRLKLKARSQNLQSQ